MNGMLDIGNTEFLIAVRSLAKDDFELYSSSVFDAWDRYIELSFQAPDYSISLEIEEGSFKGTGRIAVAVGALYLGIGSYGDFISGLQTIRGQVCYLGNKLVESAASPFGGKNVRTTYRNNGGTLTHLHRLFQSAQRGDLTVDQAMTEAERLLGDEANSSPEFIEKLNAALSGAPKYPKQVPLFELSESDSSGGVTGNNKKKPPRTPTPKPDIPTNQYRVEIWRESRRDRKKIKNE